MTYRLRSRLAAGAAFALPLAIYIASLRPGIGYLDVGELQTVPYILGIPHPSGFPAYVLLGWVWSHGVPFGDPAYRMNLLSAVAMASAALAVTGTLLELEIEPVAAGGAALVFAVSRVPWDHAIEADVHPLALAALGGAFWTALRWRRTGSCRASYACAAFAGLALAVHSGMILAIPGVVVAAFARRPSVGQGLRATALGALLVVAAYAYLPIRSAVLFAQRRDPTLALGLPPGRPFWDTDHPATLGGFRAEVAGSEFGAGHALRRLVDPGVVAQLPARFGRAAVGDLAGGILIIAAVGIAVTLRRAPSVALGLLSAALLPVLFVLAYPAESVPERYFLPAYWAIGVFVGIGADLLARGGLPAIPAPLVAVVAGLMLFVAGSDVYANRAAFAVDRDEGAQRIVDRIVRETPADAILVAPWMYATPLAYAAYVQHRLGGRIVVTGWPDDFAAYYPRWIADRPIVFVSDDPTIAVTGLRVREPDLLTPAPHLFSALAVMP